MCVCVCVCVYEEFIYKTITPFFIMFLRNLSKT